VSKRIRRTIPSPSEVATLLSYDPQTGSLQWRKKCRGTDPDREAGIFTDQGYRTIYIGNRRVLAHRIAWAIQTGAWPPENMDMDHINGNRSDNRWSNLRLASRSQNNMNAKRRSDNKSGRKGVSKRADTGKWHARIKIKGKVILLGDFTDIADAIAARAAAEPKYHAEFSRIE
jgi:hypothetical protein